MARKLPSSRACSCHLKWRHLFQSWLLNIILTLSIPYWSTSSRYSPFYTFPYEHMMETVLKRRARCAGAFFEALSTSDIASLSCGNDHDSVAKSEVDVVLVTMTINRPDAFSYVLPGFYSLTRHMLEEPRELTARACAVVVHGDAEGLSSEGLSQIPAALVRHADEAQALQRQAVKVEPGSWKRQECEDYAHALEIGAALGRHVVILEDDTLSQKRFLSEIFQILPHIQEDTILKLFKTDFYDGWTLPAFLVWSLGVALFSGIMSVCLLSGRLYMRRAAMVGLWCAIAYPLVLVPLLVGRQGFFSVMTYGFDEWSAPMTQAVLYSRKQALQASAYIREHNVEAVDVVLDEFVQLQRRKEGEFSAFSWRPSLFQHVGLKTSSAEKKEELASASNTYDYSSWFKQDSLFRNDPTEACCPGISCDPAG